jgi:uncharacterized membrane protein YwaF
MNQLILMTHVFFGVIYLLAAVWAFVEVLNASAANISRIRRVSCGAAAAMWISFLAGGWWYVSSYPADKKIILGGPWPFAHNLVMETKEHLVIMLLLVATFLPISAMENPATNRGARRLLLCVSGMVALLALFIEGEGAVIAMGVKTALLMKQM